MRNTLLSFVALVVLAVPSLAQGQAAKDWSHHTGAVPFVVGYQAGMEQARKEDKPAMLFITTTWCSWCKRLAGESFTDTSIVESLKAFVPVIVDGDVEQGVTEKFGVEGYPDVRFVAADGTEIARVRGYVPKQQFLSTVQSALTSWKDRAGGPAVVFDRPEDAKGLAVGQHVPEVTLSTASGEPFGLHAAVHGKPTVAVFYRGAWCPFCSRHLSELGKIEDELRQMGYQILAISPDAPKAGEGAAAAGGDGLTLLSDPGNAAARKFGLAFRLDSDTVAKYREMGLDLSAQDWTLPVPAAYLIGPDGKVVYAHVNPDYKHRIDVAALLEAARLALEPRDAGR